MIYDVIIIGAGPAGLMAAKGLCNNGLSIMVIDKGKALQKRKDLICGWFGNGLSELSRIELNKGECKEILDFLKEISSQKIPKKSQIVNFSYDSSLKISQYFHDDLFKKVEFSLDNEVFDIKRQDEFFSIKTERKDFLCKKCILATGKYSTDFIKKMKIVTDSVSKQIGAMGIRIEVPTTKVKDYFETYSGLDHKIDDICLYDFRMNSVVGEWEDSNIISSFGAATEEKTRKTNFFLGQEDDLNSCIRNVKIINVLNNDKIKKEFVKEFLSNKSIVSNLKSFNVIKEAFVNLNKEIVGIVDYAMIYLPEIRLNGILDVDNFMKTTVPDLYGIGGCTNRSKNILESMGCGNVVARTILNGEVNE